MKDDLHIRIERLPRWAQRYIDKLERDVASLKAERESVEAGDTRVYWHTGLERKTHLPDYAKVTFHTDGGKMECKLRDGKLVVSGDLTLYIRPIGSNMVEVVAGV